MAEIPLEEFEEAGRRALRWVVEYLEHPERYPVVSPLRPGEIRARLPATPPEEPEPLEAILRDFEEVILPGITHWNHPAFFAYFAITGSAPGILGELLSAALNVNGMLWKTSPAATELEEVVLDWLRQLLGLPEGWFGMVNDTASISTFLALAAARETLDLDIREKGMAGRSDLPRLRVYTSQEAHSSVDKAVIALGLGHENLVKIPTDEAFCMIPEALEKAVRKDQERGMRPMAVVATVGTTSSTSIDPVPAIAEIAAAYGLWLHVDAAYGGAAAILPEKREVLAGCERADSLVVNPHKWLFTPIDFSAFYTRRPEALRRAFSLIPEYLRTKEEAVTDFMNYTLQLGRRFRALKFWFVLRRYGRKGLIERIREHIRLAQRFATWVDEAPDFERLAPVPFSTVCFRAHPPGLDDEARLETLNQSLLDRVNATGKVFLSSTRLKGTYTLRLAIGNIRTEEAHVRLAWETLRKTLASLL